MNRFIGTSSKIGINIDNPFINNGAGDCTCYFDVGFWDWIIPTNPPYLQLPFTTWIEILPNITWKNSSSISTLFGGDVSTSSSTNQPTAEPTTIRRRLSQTKDLNCFDVYVTYCNSNDQCEDTSAPIDSFGSTLLSNIGQTFETFTDFGTDNLNPFDIERCYCYWMYYNCSDYTGSPTEEPSVDPTYDPTKQPSATSSRSREIIEVIIEFQFETDANITTNTLVVYFTNITRASLYKYVDDNNDCNQDITNITVDIESAVNGTVSIIAVIAVCDEEAKVDLQTALEQNSQDLSRDIIDRTNNDDLPINIQQNTVKIVIVNTEINDEDPVELADYSTIYFISAIIVVSICSLVIIIGELDANCYRINDYFAVGSVVVTMFQLLDLLSDIFLALNIGTRVTDTIFETLLIFSIISIVIPISISYSKLLYFLSICTGSSFTAVKLMNSNLFNLDAFSMDLDQKDLVRYQTKRVYSIVIMEVKYLIVWYTFVCNVAN